MRSYLDSPRLVLVAEDVRKHEVQKSILDEKTTVETWRPIEEFSSPAACYEVSNLGNVRLVLTKKPYPNDDGYACVRIIFKNKRYERKVHRLVAQAFLPNPDNLPIVNHKNYNRGDPSLSNLEWSSHQGNFDYSRTRHRARVPRGEHHALSRLSPPQVQCIRLFARWTHWRQRSIGRHFGITQHAVWCVVNRQTWKHV